MILIPDWKVLLVVLFTVLLFILFFKFLALVGRSFQSTRFYPYDFLADFHFAMDDPRSLDYLFLMIEKIHDGKDYILLRFDLIP